MRRAAFLALVLAPVFPLSGLAQGAQVAQVAQVTPERAATVQQQIRDWMQFTLGDLVTIAGNPVTVTAAGDHYDLAARLGAAPDAPMMSGKMTEAGGGRWAIDDVAIPSPSVFHTELPPAKKPGAIGGSITTTVTIGQQQQRMLIDPSFATASTWTSALKDVDLTTKASNGTQLSHIEASTGSATVTPAADGRVNVAIDSSANGYTMTVPAGPDRPSIAISMDKLAVVAALNGYSRERGGEILRLIGKAQQARSGSPKSAPLDRDTSIALLAAVADLASSVSIDEKIDGLKLALRDKAGSVEHVQMGLDSNVDGGKLRARLLVSAAGLVLPDLGLGSLAQFIPSRLTLTPTIGGVPSAATMQISRRLADKADLGDADIAALFAQGPIDAGLDDIHLDVAGSSFAGHLQMLVSSPSLYSGTGQITAENIDRLQQAMTADPEAAQIAPLLIFLKGIARAEQNRLVWDMVYRDGRLLVNGQDMGALIGSPNREPQWQPQSQPQSQTGKKPLRR